MAAEWKIFDSGENDLHVWIAYGLNFHLTPKRLKIIHACEWALLTFVKGMKIRLRRN